MGVHNITLGAGKRTKFAMTLERSAKEILAHVKGHTELPTRRIVLPEKVDVKRIRTMAGCPRRSLRARFASIREPCRNGSRGGGNPTLRPGRTSR